MVARNEVKRSAGNLAWAPDPGFRSRFIQATLADTERQRGDVSWLIFRRCILARCFARTS